MPMADGMGGILMTHSVCCSDRALYPWHPRPQLWNFEIAGLRGADEAAGLERRLQRIQGVKEATIDPLTDRACIAFDPESFDPWTLVVTIETAGYQAR